MRGGNTQTSGGSGSLKILFDNVVTDRSNGTTGITYSAGNFTNSTGLKITVLITYQILWLGIGPSQEEGQFQSWIEMTSGPEKFGFSTFDPGSSNIFQTGSVTMALAANESFFLNTYQGVGTVTVGGAGFGMNAGYTNKIHITRFS
jgi:hypothetical protein